MSGSGHWDGVAGVAIVIAQIVWYGSCVAVGYHYVALVGLAAALVVGIRTVCAAAAVCDAVEIKNLACRGCLVNRKGEERGESFATEGKVRRTYAR